MHPLFEKASGLTETIIVGAIEVHRDKGSGLIESIYGEDSAHPQSTTPELHEIAECPAWAAHQLP